MPLAWPMPDFTSGSASSDSIALRLSPTPGPIVSDGIGNDRTYRQVLVKTQCHCVYMSKTDRYYQITTVTVLT